MKLIIEVDVDNDQELKQVQSLISDHCLKFTEIKESKKRSRKDFVQWCRENTTFFSDIPSREERHER